MRACKALCRREPWRQGLASRAPLLSPRTTESMKTPVEPAISGMQTLHVQHHGRGGYRVKVRPSYVDETLAALQAYGLHHQTLTHRGWRPTEPEEWGQGCHRPWGPMGAVSPPLPVAAPQPSHQGRRTNTDWSATLFLLRWVSLVPDRRAPAGRPSGWQGVMLQSSKPSSGHPQLPLGAATLPAPGRLQWEPFTQLTSQIRAQGSGQLPETVRGWVRHSTTSEAGAFPLPHPP